MKTIHARVGLQNYDILIGPGLLAETAELLADHGFHGKVIVITDPLVRELCAGSLIESLERKGYNVTVLEVPRGEEYKTLEMAGFLYNRLAENLADRTTPILALGGGVIGDLSGFVAATYMRGVPFIQIPTTLLAQVDSSIGGKVAVDHGKLKNMIGTFYHPEFIVSDISVLKTLDPLEMSNGIAEVIKTAVISDPGFFSYLENNVEDILHYDERVLEEVVFQTASFKARIVEQDEKDTGLRQILNFGHTIGHALETISSFALRHGQAVSLGMILAGEISLQMGLFDAADQSRLIQLLQRGGLPVTLPHIDPEKILEVIRHDKKVRKGKIRFILLSSLGKAVISEEVTPELVNDVVNSHLRKGISQG